MAAGALPAQPARGAQVGRPARPQLAEAARRTPSAAVARGRPRSLGEAPRRRGPWRRDLASEYWAAERGFLGLGPSGSWRAA